MRYKLINPSDSYTFIAANRETAALITYLISPLYGAESEDGNFKVPVQIFIYSAEQLTDRIDSWFQQEFGRSMKEAAVANKNELIAALESIVYGDFDDRDTYESAMKAIDDSDKKAAFKSKWQDKRTSLNNIPASAKRAAEWLRNQDENSCNA